MSVEKIIVEIPNYEAGERGLNIRYEDGVTVEHVMDLREVSLAELVPGAVDSTPHHLRMLIACDPRLRPPAEPLRVTTLPLRPEKRDGICAWWFAFDRYEVRGGELYPRRNTRWEWPCANSRAG